MKSRLSPVFALGLLACAPPPERVCAHVADVVAAEDPGGSFDVAPCVQEAQRRKDHDRAAYEREAECVLSADSMAAISECRGQ